MALNDDLNETKSLVTDIANELERGQNAAKGTGEALRPNGSSSTIKANVSTSAPGPGGTFGSNGFASFAGGAPTSTAPSAPIPSTPERFKSADERTGFRKAVSGLGAAGLYGINNLMAAASLAPTTQESVYLEQLSNRLRFYTNGNISNKEGFNIQKQASNMGTAISALDAPTAINSLVSSGLMPGLKNFRAGTGYTGILGGAALASNLTPGIGITGGAGVMAGLNQASNVNMLKMFGVQVRTPDGTGMNDLSNIIDQLYTLLARNGPVSERDIAISAMSGNALDSIINQYFGGDPNIRSTIIAGLIQKSKGMGFAKTTSKKYPKRGSLEESGALTQGAMTTSNRSTSELQMLQKLSNPVVQGLTRANNIAQGMFNFMGSEGDKNTKAGAAIRAGLNITTMMETLSGIRGGAGGLLADTATGGYGALAVGGVSVIKTLNDALTAGKLDLNPESTGISTTGATMASKAGPLYTGAITINVTTTGDDPYAFGDAIYKAMTAKS
jgi:hypothetical protein